jgi:hypothetical protein
MVTIRDDSEDPAYAIIRNAIKKRKYYLEQVNGFTCKVYIKGIQKLTKYPEKFLGNVINFGGLVDSTTGIFYLSESVSNFSFRQPDRIKEEMISSRISGNSRAFSYNQASDMMFNFYENKVMGKAISDKGYISPIASNALFYYAYKLLGSTVENDVLIHKIELKPKRTNDPVFRGIIYIADGSWRIQNIDAYLTREAGIEFLDTLRIRQTFLPVDKNDTWMAVNNRFDFSFRFLGFIGGGNYVGYFSDFEINPEFNKRSFSAEVLKIDAEANKKDSLYWNTIRPIPLSEEETLDYLKKDSLQTVRMSKNYNDSMDRITNKFSLSSFVLNGYTYKRSYRKMSYAIQPFLNTIAYNTVEGWNISMHTEYVKRFENRKRVDGFSDIRYGFSNQHWNGSAGFRYLFNRFNESSISIEGGSMVSQLNNTDPVSPFINSLYTLYAAKNYLKLFEKKYGQIKFGREWFNGFTGSIHCEFSKNIPLYNTSNITWSRTKNRELTSNNPLQPDDKTNPFSPYESLTFTFSTDYTVGSKYITRPDRKVREESKWPTLHAKVKQAVAGIFNSNTNFTIAEVGFNHDFDLGMLGYVNYLVSYSTFLNKKTIYFPDYMHLKGNLTWFSSFSTASFQNLDYYAYSTTSNAVQFHFEYHLNRFLTNKIPFFRKLKLNEIAAFRVLHVSGLPLHTEISFGLEKLNLIRIDFVNAYTGNSRPSFAFRFGLKLNR